VTSRGALGETWLVGDVGATNARFGLVSPEREVLHTRTLAVADHPTIADAITAYLGERGALPTPRQGAIAIASASRSLPVHTGLASFGEIGLTGRLRAAACTRSMAVTRPD